MILGVVPPGVVMSSEQEKERAEVSYSGGGVSQASSDDEWGVSSSEWGSEDFMSKMEMQAEQGIVKVEPPIDVLKELLGGNERTNELATQVAEMSTAFESPKPHEMIGYTVENLGKVQACTSRESLGLTIDEMGARNQFGVSLLHKACRYPSWPAACTIASMRREVCAMRDDLGRLPMHDACWNRHVDFDAVQLLLTQYPVALLAADHRGHSPLSYVPRDLWPQWCCFLKNSSLAQHIEVSLTFQLHSLPLLIAGGPTSNTTENPQNDDVDHLEDEVNEVTPEVSQRQSERRLSSPLQKFAGKRLRQEAEEDEEEEEEEDDEYDDDASSSSSEDSENTGRNWALAGQIAATLCQGRNNIKRRRQERTATSWLALSVLWPSCKGSAQGLEHLQKEIQHKLPADPDKEIEDSSSSNNT